MRLNEVVRCCQFLYNLQQSEAISKRPFEIIIRFEPTNPDTITSTYKGKSLVAFKRTPEWHEEVDITRAYPENSIKKMKKWVDSRRRHVEYKEHDQIMIKLLPQQFKTLGKVLKRLMRWYKRFFLIIRRVANILYQLWLQLRLKIHPVFHESFLKLYHRDAGDLSRGESRHAPTTLIIAFDIDVSTYFMKWKDLSDNEASWEYKEDLW